MNLPNPKTMEAQLSSMAGASQFNHWLFSQVEACAPFRRVWEIGAGIGSISEFLLSADFLCLTEFDTAYREILSRKFFGRKNVVVEHADLTQLNVDHFRAYNFDTIISTNVIEHIFDDKKAFTAISEAMGPDAILITLVPAHPFLFGSMDKDLQHHRRYTKNSLREALRAGGQELLSLRYFNRIGALGWLLKFKIFRSHSVSATDISVVEKLLPIFKLERFFPLPFGLSLIAVSRKTR